MKTISDFENDITDAVSALRGAQDPARRDKLRHRIVYSRKRIAELQGNDPKSSRQLSEDEFNALGFDEYKRLFGSGRFALFEIDIVPAACRDEVAAEVARG